MQTDTLDVVPTVMERPEGAPRIRGAPAAGLRGVAARTGRCGRLGPVHLAAPARAERGRRNHRWAPVTIVLPALSGQQAQSWHTLMSVAGSLGEGWTLVGGQTLAIGRTEEEARQRMQSVLFGWASLVVENGGELPAVPTPS